MYRAVSSISASLNAAGTMSWWWDEARGDGQWWDEARGDGQPWWWDEARSDAAAVVPKAGLTAMGSAGDGQRGAKRQSGSRLGWTAESAEASADTDAELFFLFQPPWDRWKCYIYPSEAYKAVSTEWWKAQEERLTAAGATLTRRTKRHHWCHADGEVIPKEINVRGSHAK